MAHLTDTKLRSWLSAAAPIAGKSDGGGLTFTLSRTGTASWVFRYRFGGKQRELTLGNYPDVPLGEARKAATAARAKVDAGADPAGDKKRFQAVLLSAKQFREIAEDYLKRAGRQLAAKSHGELQRYLHKDLLPRLGSLTARDVGPQEIVDTIERIAERSDSVARHAFEIISVIFAHALARHDVPSNPCAGLRLASILGPRPERRARLKLSKDELRDLLASLPALGKINALCAKILLATCVRKGELIRARKTLINPEAGTWFIPDENSKSGKGYVVPLAPSVAGWFRELVALSGDSQWLLPAMSRRGRLEDRHMSDKTLNAALARCPQVRIRDFTPHDLRSTARSHLAELGVNPIVAERCLNHALGGLVAVYDQHDYLDERRKALELWAGLLKELDTTSAGEKVIPLRAVA
jgi:integrase